MQSLQLPRLGYPVSLYSAKMAKKQSEEELHKIQNRITLLKTEQTKLTKKIQSSEQKAQDMYTAKRVHNDNKEQKIKDKLDAPLPFTYPIHLKQQESLQKIKLSEKVRRHNQAQMIRYENKYQVSQARAQQKLNLEELRAKAQDIKDKEVSSAHLVSKKIRDRRDKIRQDISNEADMVLNDKQQYDLMIRQLEQDELTALRTLQQTQTMHLNISQKLHLAKSLSPKQFASKYLCSSEEKAYSQKEDFEEEEKSQSNEMIEKQLSKSENKSKPQKKNQQDVRLQEKLDRIQTENKSDEPQKQVDPPKELKLPIPRNDSGMTKKTEQSYTKDKPENKLEQLQNRKGSQQIITNQQEKSVNISQLEKSIDPISEQQPKKVAEIKQKDRELVENTDEAKNEVKQKQLEIEIEQDKPDAKLYVNEKLNNSEIIYNEAISKQSVSESQKDQIQEQRKLSEQSQPENGEQKNIDN